MDNLHIGLQVGLRTNLHAIEWLAKHPKVFNDFNVFMSAQREGRAYWLDFYPLEQKLSAEARDNKQDVLFVDVGGALGREIKELRKRYPSVKGRMILQDQQQTIDHVSVDPGMEAMVHLHATICHWYEFSKSSSKSQRAAPTSHGLPLSRMLVRSHRATSPIVSYQRSTNAFFSYRRTILLPSQYSSRLA